MKIKKFQKPADKLDESIEISPEKEAKIRASQQAALNNLWRQRQEYQQQSANKTDSEKYLDFLDQHGILYADDYTRKLKLQQLGYSEKFDKDGNPVLTKNLEPPLQSEDFDFAMALAGGLGTKAAAKSFGWLPTIAEEIGAGTVGTAATYGSDYLGQAIDNKYGTNIRPWLTIGGGLTGAVLGGHWGNRGAMRTAKYAVDNGIRGYGDFHPAIQEEILKTPKPSTEQLLNVEWAPAQTMNVRRALDLDPNKVYSEQELQSLINSYQPTTFHEDASVRENLLDRHSIDDLKTVFNNSFKTGGRLLQDGGRTIKIYSDDSAPVIKRDIPSLPIASASTVIGGAKPIKKPKLDKPTLKEAVTSAHDWTKKWYKGRPNLLYKASYNETVSDENDARIKRFENSYRKLDPLPIVGAPEGNEKSSAKFWQDKSGLKVQNPFYNKKYDTAASQKVTDFYDKLEQRPVVLKRRNFGSKATTAAYSPSADITLVKPGRRDAWENALIHEFAHENSMYVDENGQNKFRSNFYTDTDKALQNIEAGRGHEYWDSPHEEYARLHQVAHAMDLDPKKVYSPEEIETRIMDVFNSGNYSDWNADAILRASARDPKTLARQLNNSL